MKKIFLWMICLSMIVISSSGCSSLEEKKTEKKAEESVPSPASDEQSGKSEATYDEYLESIVLDGICYEIEDDRYAVVTGYDEEQAQENVEIPVSITYEGTEYQVEAIAEEAFLYDDVLCSITFPNSLSTIGKEAFCGCASLMTVLIPSGAATLGTGIFYDCSALVSCVISEGIVSLPNEMFTNCYALEDVQLPDTLLTIGEETFWACESLKEMTLPDSVVSIGSRAFYGSGVQTFTIPSKSVNLTEDMLEGMDELETLYADEQLISDFEEYVYQDVSVLALEK